jgi:hypothetical protein
VPEKTMNDRERDASMERLLREAMAAEVRTESPQCLDAETLAAWSDGQLTKAERSAAQSHASTCPRCQGMLAAMVRTGAALPVDASSRSPLRKWLMMLGPAVATAAAIALWFAVDRSQAPETALQRSTQTAQEPAASPSPTALAGQAANEKVAVDRYREGAQSSDAERRLADARTKTEADAPAPPTANAASQRAQAQARNLGAPNAQAAPAEEPRDRARAERETQTGQAQPPRAPFRTAADAPPVAVTAAPPPPATPPPPRPASIQQQAPPPPQQTQAQQSAGNREDRTVVTEALRDSKVAEGFAAGRGAGGGGRGIIAGAAPRPADSLDSVARRAALSFDVVSPDPLVRWRVTDGRVVQGSRDGGTTWTAQYPVADPQSRALDATRVDAGAAERKRSAGGLGVSEPGILTAGIAPSATVVWLAGRAGLILLTTNGSVWQRVKFPEAVDLVTVTATDARTATVTAADGRTFVTSNGGASWAIR